MDVISYSFKNEEIELFQDALRRLQSSTKADICLLGDEGGKAYS